MRTVALVELFPLAITFLIGHALKLFVIAGGTLLVLILLLLVIDRAKRGKDGRGDNCEV